MEDFVYLTILFDYYNCMFTKKQQEYFIDYYENNLTMQEIADNNGVSKNAVSKQLEVIKEKLLLFESQLKLYEKKQRVCKIIKDDETRKKIEEIL